MDANLLGRSRLAVVEVLTPRSLDEALRAEGRAARRGADPGRHRRDGRAQLRPRAAAGAAEPERGARAARAGRARTARCGSAPGSPTPRRWGSPSRCPRWPRPRARSAGRRSATAARSAATSARPRRPGDALPPLLVDGAEVELASTRRLAHGAAARVPRRAEAERARAGRADRRRPDPAPGPRQTFMKVGPRNAMVIAVVSLALVVDGDELRAVVRLGRAGAGPRRPRRSRSATPSRSRWPRRRARSTTCAAPPRYRRHALRVLTERALERCLA